MTHVPIHTSWPTEPLGRIENILTDGCGSVEAWDFSLANSSYEARVYFVSKVASICYGNPKALGSISLFDRLQAEAAGLCQPLGADPDLHGAQARGLHDAGQHHRHPARQGPAALLRGRGVQRARHAAPGDLHPRIETPECAAARLPRQP